MQTDNGKYLIQYNNSEYSVSACGSVWLCNWPSDNMYTMWNNNKLLLN